MKLDFILSDTTAASTLAAIDEIVKKAENTDESIIVLVPETSSLCIEKLLLERQEAFSNVFVYSFVRLLEKIDVSQKSRYISRDSAILITRKVIFDNYEKLTCFKKSAKSLGFAEIMYDTIAQFKASRITHDDVVKMINTAPAALVNKLSDILTIFDAYTAFITGNFLDNCDKLDLLTHVVGGSDFVSNAHIYLVGFDSITAQGVELIEVLTKISRGVKVACSFIPKNAPNAYITENEVFEKCKHLADKYKLNYNPTRVEIKRNKAFSHLAKNLYAYPNTSIADDGTVAVYKAETPAKEAEYVAKKVAKLLKDGLSASDIAIVCPSPDEYNIHLSYEFSAREIPLFISTPIPLLSHPLFGLVRSLLGCLRTNCEAEEVRILMKNPLCELAGVDEFENLCLKFGTNYHGFFRPFHSKNIDGIDQIEQTRKALADFLTRFFDALDGAQTCGQMAQAVLKFLDEIDIKSRLERLYQTQIMLDELSAKVTSQVLDKLTDGLESIIMFLGDTFTDIAEFGALFETLGLNEISLLPLTVGEVVCVPDTSSISPEVKVMIVCGATDGVVPLRVDDCGIIGDNELVSMGDTVHKKIEPTIRTVNRRERLKAFSLCLQPTEKLIFTYPSFNSAGEEAKPSALIDWVSRLLGVKVKEAEPFNFKLTKLKVEPERISSVKMARNFLAKNISLRQLQMGHIPDDDLAALRDAIFAVSAPEDRIVFESLWAGKPEFTIGVADKLYFKNGTVSISQLEKYFACPMQHFVTYGLGLKERENGEIRPLDIGNILHLIAEKFVKVLMVTNPNNLNAVADKLLGDAIGELEIVPEKNGVVLSLLKGEARRLVRVLFEQCASSDFKPQATELPFGKLNKDGAMGVTFDGGIKLVGKIDRIDTTDKYFKLIDYKTGSISVSPDDVFYGKKIQLISYLLAMRGYRGLKPAGVLYFPIRNEFAEGEAQVPYLYRNRGIIANDFGVVLAMDNTISLENPCSKYIFAELKNNKQTRETGEMVLKTNTNLVSEETLDGLMTYVYAVADRALFEIKFGNIAPSPINSAGASPCMYCPLKNLCGNKGSRFEGGRFKFGGITNEIIADVGRRFVEHGSKLDRWIDPDRRFNPLYKTYIPREEREIKLPEPPLTIEKIKELRAEKFRPLEIKRKEDADGE